MTPEKLAEGKRLVAAAKATGLDETSTTRENGEAKRWLLRNARDLLAAATELTEIRRTLQVALNRQGPRPDTTLDFLAQLIEEHQEDLATAQAAEERAQEAERVAVDQRECLLRAYADVATAERERDEAKARLAQFESAEEYDAQRGQPVGDEAKSIWRRILDKPHWALPAIQSVVKDRDEAKRVLEIMERDLRGRLELVTSRLRAVEDRMDDVCRADICFQSGNDAGGLAWMEKAFEGYTRTTERKS